VQGTEIIAKLRGGATVRRRMDDLTPADPESIRARFRAACGNAEAIEAAVDSLEFLDDASVLSTLAGKPEHVPAHR
jgi:hypothetical protein